MFVAAIKNIYKWTWPNKYMYMYIVLKFCLLQASYIYYCFILMLARNVVTMV